MPIIGKELLKTSTNILTDVVDRDESFKGAIRKRGRESLKNLTHEAMRGMSGSGLPPKKRRKLQSKSKSRPVKKSTKKVPRKNKPTKTKKAKSKVPVNARFAYL